MDYAWLFTIGWLATIIAASVLYRRNAGKAIFPRAPNDADFAEERASGRSLKNLLSSIGGARNCLLVYVADRTLTIVPTFPFNLMFLPEIYGMEVTAPTNEVSVEETNERSRKRIVLSVAGQRFELLVRDQQAFRDALARR